MSAVLPAADSATAATATATSDIAIPDVASAIIAPAAAGLAAVDPENQPRALAVKSNNVDVSLLHERIEESSNASNAARTTVHPMPAPKPESRFASFKKSLRRSLKRYSIEMSIPAVAAPPPDAEDINHIAEEDEEGPSGDDDKPPPSPSMQPSSGADTPNQALSAASSTPTSGASSPVPGSDAERKERAGSLRKTFARRFSFTRLSDKEKEKEKEKEKDKDDGKNPDGSPRKRERRLSSSSIASLGSLSHASLASIAGADNPDIRFFDTKLKALFKKGAKQSEKLAIIQELIPVLRVRSFDFGTAQWPRLVVAGSLLECWKFLLKNVSGSSYEARAFYFRAIVLIMKRHELRLHEITDDAESLLPDLYSEYSRLVWDTHSYVIERLTRKLAFVSLLGFSLEVLAINYFLMPTLASHIVQVVEQSYQDAEPELDAEVNELVAEIRHKDAANNTFPRHPRRRTSSVSGMSTTLPSTFEGLAPLLEVHSDAGSPPESPTSAPHPTTTAAATIAANLAAGKTDSVVKSASTSSLLSLHAAMAGKTLDTKPVVKGPWLDKFSIRKEPEFFLMFLKTLCRRIGEINLPTAHGSPSGIALQAGGGGVGIGGLGPMSPGLSIPTPMSGSESMLSTSPGNASSLLSTSPSNANYLSTSPSNGLALKSEPSDDGNLLPPGVDTSRRLSLGRDDKNVEIDWFAVRGYSTFLKSFVALALSNYFPADVRESMQPPPPMVPTYSQPHLAHSGVGPAAAAAAAATTGASHADKKPAKPAAAPAPSTLTSFFTPELMVVFENPHVINIVTKVFLRRTSVINIRAVTCTMSFIHDLVSHYCHLQMRPLPTEFDSDYFLKAISVLFESQHYVVLMATLSFLYRHMHVFSEACRQDLTTMLTSRFFFKFFLHWQGSVRWFFYHILLYRMMPFSQLKSIEDFISVEATGPEQFPGAFSNWCQANPMPDHDVAIARKMHESVMCIRARYTVLVTLARSALQAQHAQNNPAAATAVTPGAVSPAAVALAFGAPLLRPPVFALDFELENFSYQDSGSTSKNLDAHCGLAGCKLGDIARALKEYIDCQAENIKWIRERVSQGMLPAAEDIHQAFPKLLLKLPNLKAE
ncbi:hypothetical protein CAOG_03854 [Capsaspora owczarzaki ATCC 30864]|uniref:Uncharacterized protein n=1 Tax=Capsaspora owczarzaki (strain ATCC 30864) TaxID=595528 RepID=A0A0D2UD45_CAPO3|nr:hypothetical protein CAOG_03854 [Capsaspora owczarzaki ATCC 30864]KJE92986.1 hypothetical protein CAOG_003854 [Capsaspora owczarzaki ATCC 30864]|eukprot:XP_004363582.2 hypothetical protein CAOG_03854 [Capsaspora owczarzaki ATCC 30864]